MIVKSLHEEILPHLQDIYAEGGNMSANWVDRVVLDTLEARRLEQRLGTGRGILT